MVPFLILTSKKNNKTKGLSSALIQFLWFVWVGCLHSILPCTSMIWRNRTPFHCGNQNSYSSRQAGWSAAMWKSSGFSWAPHRQLSQRQHLAWCCSAAPQTGAWTGWPEAVASVASRWTSGERKQHGRFEIHSYICCHIDCVCVCAHYVSKEDFIHYTSTAAQSSLCFTAWGLSVSIISVNSATLCCLSSHWFLILCVPLLTTTPNCSDSAKSSYSSFISPRTLSCSGAGSCLIRFYTEINGKIYVTYTYVCVINYFLRKKWVNTDHKDRLIHQPDSILVNGQ